ncbi:uncharacterized protein [Bemisia tabaci]
MVTWIRAGLLIYLCQFLAPISSGSDEAKLHEGKTREKRGAVYPVGTVLQFSVALAYPIEIPKRKAATNLGVLINIDLPFNITQLYPYTPEVDQARALSHDALYDDLARILSEHGFNGQECILKSICQIAGRKSEKDDLGHSFLQLLFR